MDTTGQTRETRGRRSAVWVMGVFTALLALDLAVGAALGATNALPGEQGSLLAAQEQGVRAMMSAPPVVDEPWAQAYVDELIDYQVRDPNYLPFLVDGPHEFQGDLINTTDRERVSYQPELDPEVDPLRVAFIGGSTVFGMGQRDEHTIVSAFARVAEESGVPVEAHAYGFPGWVSWQEFQYYERLVAEGGEWDLVAFYDGFNEFDLQSYQYSVHPTHVGAPTLDDLAADYQDEQEAQPGLFDTLADLASAYRRNSALSRLSARIRGDTPSIGSPGVLADPDDQADAALDLYTRSLRRIEGIARDEATPVRFYWQPRRDGWPAEVTDRLPSQVVDLSHVFDGREDEIYIDPIHTTEAGARLVAEAMWADMGPDLEVMVGSPMSGVG